MRPFDELMREELIRASFDFDHPQPAVGWQAFKSFVMQAVHGQQTIALGFSCFHAADRDRVLWLEFARQLEDDAGVGQMCGCAFSRSVPTELHGVEKSNWWWPQHGTRDEWFREVETAPEFITCVALDGWRFEGYSL